MAILKLSEADAAQAAKLGIKSVICNRPDGEEAGQPAFAQVQQWLTDNGIGETTHQPVTAPNINATDVNNFHILLENSATPILAYCRTGTRSALLWAYYQVQHGSSTAEVKAAALQAGVDLSKFDVRLQAATDNGL